MKDYTLSEVMARCSKLIEKYGAENACDYCRNDEELYDFCNEKLSDIPCEWKLTFDPEPRDIMELPCKQTMKVDDSPTFWNVFFRSKYGVDFEFFMDEAEADEFLAELKEVQE